MSTIELTFQTSAGGANLVSFNLDVPKGTHDVSELLGKAYRGDPKSTVQVPDTFAVNEIQLSKPSQLGSGGSVEIQYPSGVSNHVGFTTLTQTSSPFEHSTGIPIKQFKIIVK